MPNFSGMWTIQAQMQAKSQGLWSLQGDNGLWLWGYNNNGELGQGDITSRSSPVQVGALTTWSKIAGGDYHTIAITSV